PEIYTLSLHDALPIYRQGTTVSRTHSGSRTSEQPGRVGRSIGVGILRPDDAHLAGIRRINNVVSERWVKCPAAPRCAAQYVRHRQRSLRRIGREGSAVAPAADAFQ